MYWSGSIRTYQEGSEWRCDVIALAPAKDQTGCVVLHSLQTVQFRVWKASEQGVTVVHYCESRLAESHNFLIVHDKLMYVYIAAVK